MKIFIVSLKVLVIAAHPDDEILGMGGTILRHTTNGDIVKVIILATGITSRRSSQNQNSPKYETSKTEDRKMEEKIEKLKRDSISACKIVKVSKVVHYDFPDNEMDSIPLLKVVKVIEKNIKDFKPDTVYTHHRGDLNVDHKVAYNATLTACRPIGISVKEIICFEIPSSTEWNFPQKFNPNYFVNITKQLDRKIKAMEVYKSEIRKFPHPRSSKYIRILAEKWGAVSGNNSAEAFEIIRKIEK